jgi:hypothetical protein
VRKICAGVNMIYSRAELVFVLDHYFASISFAAVREASGSSFAYNEIQNKATVH